MMSRDIRSFFKPNKAAAAKKPVIEDDDDVIPESPDVHIKTKKKESKKRVILDDSDEEIFTNKKKKSSPLKNESSKRNKHKTPDKPALKTASIIDAFSGPIKRTEPLVKKTKKKTETGIHSDEDFEKSLLEVDISEDINPKKCNGDSNDIPKDSKAKADTKSDRSPSKINGTKETDPKQSSNDTNESRKDKERHHKTSSKKDTEKHHKTSSTEDTERTHKTGDSTKKEKPKHHSESHSKKEAKKEIKIRDSKTEVKEKNIPLTSNSSPEQGQTKEPKNETITSDKDKKVISNGHGEMKKEIKKESELHKKGDHVKERDANKSLKKESKIVEESPNKETKTGENEKVSKNDKKRDFSVFLDDSVVDLDDTTEFDTPKNKKKKIDKSLNESALTDEERHERKRHSAALYQQYLNRSGPKHLGAKQLPEGTPNCLANCAFLLTGVLDSFEREEISAAIARYGGCVKSGVTKKVTHVLAGEDAGPAKMAKAQELGIPIIGEDDFIKLILQNSKSSSKREIKKEKSPERKTPKKDTKDKSKEKIERSKSDSHVKIERKKEKKETEKEDKVIEIKDEIKSKSCEVAPLTKQESSKESIVGLGAPNTLMWVDKYKPQNIKQIIGQHGDASNVKKLMNWLSKWYLNRKAKLPKPNPWAKGDDGGYYKAVLLSGPPGVGKTTTVSLVCAELGFDAVEYNASDTRNKNLIREQIGELLTTNSLAGFAKGVTGKQAVTKKHVLVMDEVDGMAGNEDRGGMQELISLIKATSVPIICMCNDRNSQKMRSLVNYCYDLRFSRPRVEQIKSAMMSICCKEGIRIPPDALTQLIVAANQDVRQTLNLLSMWAVDSNLTDSERLKSDAQGGKKDVKLGPWEAVRKVFSAEEHKSMSIHDKSDLFFYDYSMAPLFVQENYLQVVPHCPKNEMLERFSAAADSISAGDLVDARIRRQQAWGLLPTQAMYASVIPGTILSGHVAGAIQFPGWLGKNSRATKMQRLCQEIHAHTRLSTSGSKSSVFLDYSTHLRDAIINPLLRDKSDGIDKSLEVLESYHLLREDLESLLELSLWPGQRNPMILIDSKVKAAMTRAYNKRAPALPYAPGAVRRGRAAGGIEGEEGGEEGEEGEEEEPDSDPENDALIKKKKVKEEKASTSKEKASTSRGKEKAGSSKDRPSSSKSKKK